MQEWCKMTQRMMQNDSKNAKMSVSCIMMRKFKRYSKKIRRGRNLIRGIIMQETDIFAFLESFCIIPWVILHHSWNFLALMERKFKRYSKKTRWGRNLIRGIIFAPLTLKISGMMQNDSKNDAEWLKECKNVCFLHNDAKIQTIFEKNTSGEKFN